MSPPALPAVPKNAPEFATMVSNNPEAWFDFVKQMLDKHRALEQDLFNTRQELEIVKQELGESQKAQEQQLAVAAELRTLLAAANATAYSSANLHYANRPRSKLDVPEFSGVKKDYAEFKAQLQIKLVTDSAEYQDEQTACAYIISKLKGPAFHQVYPRIKDGRYTGQTAVELIKLLDLIYEDPHRQETATREIMALRQKNRPFSDFMADFRRLEGDGDFNETALKATLTGAISDELRAATIHHDTSGSFESFVELLSNLDGKMRAATELQRSFTQRTAGSNLRYNQSTIAAPPATPQPSSPITQTTTYGGDAMDLSSARRGPLTPEERAYRLANALCLYCGKPGHVSRTCTNRRAPPPVRLSTVAFGDSEMAASLSPSSQEKA